MTRNVAVSVAMAVAAAAVGPGLTAQTLVTGRVTGGSRPLAHAEVTIEPGQGGTMTDSGGRYRLTVAVAGIVRISARAVGYFPDSRRIILAGNDTLRVDFALDPTAQQLDSVTVNAPAVPVRGKMAAFEERRAAGIGRFFTREMLAQQEHSSMDNVLRMVAGLQLVRRPADCGGGYALATNRGGFVNWQPWMQCAGLPMVAACYLAIYLDGARYWAPAASEPPPDVSQFTIQGLEGIEVYRGPAETPIQYQMTGSACGVAILWTRQSP
jgi:Carboxypeptidase regulatory-like domain/TonB-dependent Receptor Plug Domain